MGESATLQVLAEIPAHVPRQPRPGGIVDESEEVLEVRLYDLVKRRLARTATTVEGRYAALALDLHETGEAVIRDGFHSPMLISASHLRLTDAHDTLGDRAHPERRNWVAFPTPGGAGDATRSARAIPLQRACRALRWPRASVYRRLRPRVPISKSEHARTSLRALSPAELREVLALLHAERFVDQPPPREVYATQIAEGRYLCSARTMYRLLAVEVALPPEVVANNPAPPPTPTNRMPGYQRRQRVAALRPKNLRYPGGQNDDQGQSSLLKFVQTTVLNPLTFRVHLFTFC
jgi:hypothetical protein